MSVCDLAVIGAGPAGAAAAIRAASGGLKVVLLDRAAGTRRWPGESLPPGFTSLLRSVFGAAMLQPPRAKPAYGTRAAWGGDDLVETDFQLNPLGNGWTLDRGAFDAAARAAALAAGVVLERARRLDMAPSGADWRIDLDGRLLRAGFVIDATGRSAALLRRLRIRRVAADRQVAVVAAWPDPEGDPFAGTTVEAVRDGWWYATPLPDGRRVLAFLTDADLWREGARDWHARLARTNHMRRIAGPGAAAATPRTTPASTDCATRIAGENWLAVGDAAASFDPLSSQGLATAVLMGAKAGEALAAPDRASAIADWSDAYAMIVAEHAALRAHYAAEETRWPDTPFWRRRRSPEAQRRPAWIG